MSSARFRHFGTLATISRSNIPDKKYKVVLEWPNGKKKTIHFGGMKKLSNGTYVPYEQYKDITPLRLYSKYNHLDKNRRNRYYNRHGKSKDKYSPGYFANKFLWPLNE